MSKTNLRINALKDSIYYWCQNQEVKPAIMYKMLERTDLLKKCIYYWCQNQEAKQTMMMYADEVLEYIKKSEQQQQYQLTAEEINALVEYFIATTTVIKIHQKSVLKESPSAFDFIRLDLLDRAFSKLEKQWEELSKSENE